MSNAETTVATKQESLEEVVSMTDGRKVGFVGRKQIDVTNTVTADGIVLRFDFRNGETYTFSMDIHDQLLPQAAAHGLEQKLRDEMAANPAKFSLEDRIEWFKDLATRLSDTSKTPEERWKAPREGAGESGISALVLAIMEVKGKTAADVKSALTAQAKTLGISRQELVTQLRRHPSIKPTVDRIEAARASKHNIDPGMVDSVLAAMD